MTKRAKKQTTRRSVKGRLRRAANQIVRDQFVAANGLPSELRPAQEEILRLRRVIDDLSARYNARVDALERAHDVLRVAGHQVIESLNTLAKRLETRP